MAAHNLVNILKSHATKQERPLYLQPMDNEGNYLWCGEGIARPNDGVHPDDSRDCRKRGALADDSDDQEKGNKRMKRAIAASSSSKSRRKLL